MSTSCASWVHDVMMLVSWWHDGMMSRCINASTHHPIMMSCTLYQGMCIMSMYCIEYMLYSFVWTQHQGMYCTSHDQGMCIMTTSWLHHDYIMSSWWWHDDAQLMRASCAHELCIIMPAVKGLRWIVTVDVYPQSLFICRPINNIADSSPVQCSSVEQRVPYIS